MTEAVFRATVKAWVESHNTARVELAARFDCMLSTVDRWWIGTNRPHPLLQEQVVTWIQERLKGTR